jgi:hypothetical protein
MNALKPIDLPPELALRRILSVAQAAELMGISRWTLERNHPHLIRKLSARRRGVSIGDALAVSTRPTA